MRGKFRLLFGHLHAGVAVFFAILNSDLLIDTAVSSRRGRQWDAMCYHDSIVMRFDTYKGERERTVIYRSHVHIFVTIIGRLVNIVTEVYLQFVDHNITIMRRRRFNLHIYFLIYPFSWKCHFEASCLFVIIEDTVFYARRWPAFVVAWWHIFYPHAVEVR